MFTYWLNEKAWHERKLFECEAKDIIEADELFKQATGTDPMKRCDVTVIAHPTPSERVQP
jgi:hypothetical protein